MHCPTNAHWDAMCQCIRYVRGTPTKGLLLKPFGTWNGKDRSFKFVIRGRSDSNYATDKDTQRSLTGALVYLNKAPITWFSKQQSTVESSTFGSEFVALRLATEQIISMRYKLRMFGIPIDGWANTFCDNESVFKNSSIAESRLKKKHNSVCFHRVREAVASSILIPLKVDSKFNLADILTKALPPPTRLAIRKMIMPSHI